MGRYTNKATGPGVTALVNAGVPLGLLSKNNRFWRARSGAKYHATQSCNRVNSRKHYVDTSAVYVDMSATKDDRYCVDCVHGPTDSDTLRYRDHARRVLRARALLAQLQGYVTADQPGAAPVEVEAEISTSTDKPSDVPATAVPVEPLNLDQITATSWRRVTQAKSIRVLMESVHDDPQVHPVMAEFAADAYKAAVELHKHLEHLAVSATDDSFIVRGCVVDMLGDLPSSQPPTKITAPVAKPDRYPAACTHNYGTRAVGYKERVNSAWVAWGDQVKLDGDLAAARVAAMHAGSFADLTPEHVPQLPKGAARTPAPASGNPWDWMVAEWRLAATDELAAIVTEWEQAYTAALRATETEPYKVIGLPDYDLAARTNVNASTEVLSHLTVVVDEPRKYGIVIAPAAVARWLAEFGFNGIRATRSHYQPTNTAVVELADATPSDGTDTFETMFRLWSDTGDKNRNRNSRDQLESIKTVLDVARGIHHKDAS